MDASASRGDLHVARACGAKLLFVRPGAAEDRVGVGVDPTWQQYTAFAVNSRDVGELALQFDLRPYGGYVSVAHGDRGSGEEAQIVHLDAAACASGAGAGDDLCGVDEEHVRHASTSSTRERPTGA